MANARELEKLSRAFAQQMQDLLNHTVCDGARFGAVYDSRAEDVVAGTNVRRGNFESSPVRLLTKTQTPLWIDVSCRLTLDDLENLFLAVKSSFYAIHVGPTDERRAVLHYDFEREKDKYTEAHIQVHGSHPAFEAYAAEVGAKEQLSKYHLPVGGRRMRPCLEDVIEFLIAERLVKPRPGWEDALDEQRIGYRKKQIAALVRKHHGVAIEELRRIGYTVFNPQDASRRELAKLLFTPKPRKPKDDRTGHR